MLVATQGRHAGRVHRDCAGTHHHSFDVTPCARDAGSINILRLESGTTHGTVSAPRRTRRRDGRNREPSLLSDYTFAVRGPDFPGTGELLGGLLKVGKAYSGVTDAEIAELTDFLKAHTLEDQGHFRTVEPLVILEVAFNNIMRSPRHASGFALRFPRILRLRPDKPLAEIDTLDRVEEIYQSQVDKPAED